MKIIILLLCIFSTFLLVSCVNQDLLCGKLRTYGQNAAGYNQQLIQYLNCSQIDLGSRTSCNSSLTDCIQLINQTTQSQLNNYTVVNVPFSNDPNRTVEYMEGYAENASNNSIVQISIDDFISNIQTWCVNYNQTLNYTECGQFLASAIYSSKQIFLGNYTNSTSGNSTSGNSTTNGNSTSGNSTSGSNSTGSVLKFSVTLYYDQLVKLENGKLLNQSEFIQQISNLTDEVHLYFRCAKSGLSIDRVNSKNQTIIDRIKNFFTNPNLTISLGVYAYDRSYYGTSCTFNNTLNQVCETIAYNSISPCAPNNANQTTYCHCNDIWQNFYMINTLSKQVKLLEKYSNVISSLEIYQGICGNLDSVCNNCTNKNTCKNIGDCISKTVSMRNNLIEFLGLPTCSTPY